MAESVQEKLAKLPKLGVAELNALWQSVTGTHPPPVTKSVLVRALAYKLQESAFGGLSRPLHQRIRKLSQSTHGGVLPIQPDAMTSTIKVGTRMIRQWQGKTHEVTLTDAGYVYNGRHYRSLSEIARLITGTRWSGPLFFGLKSFRPSNSSGEPEHHAR